MSVRLIALDLDGTLLSSRKVITPRTRQVLIAARERGVTLVIASGRTVQSAGLFSRQLGGGPIIACNGAAVTDRNGEVVQARGIPMGPLRAILQRCMEERLLAECYTPDGLYLDRPWEQVQTYLRWVRPHQRIAASVQSLIKLWRVNRIRPVRSLLRWTEARQAPTVLKLMVIGERGRLRNLGEAVRRETPGLAVTSSGPDNLEVMAAGVSKGAGLQALGARLQIPADVMLAFGDAENDREMLRYVGIGVAMGNAVEALKADADRVTGSCDEDGIAQVVEALCLG